MKIIEHISNKRSLRLKKIGTSFLSALLVILMIALNVSGSMLTTVALEQEARCEIEEHIHSDTCFRNEILVCEKTAHVHDSNCYIVLLEENDINYLLEEIDNNEEKSLEGVISEITSSEQQEPSAEQTDSEQPDTEQPDTEQPDTEQSDTEQTDTEQPDTEQPDTEQTDTEQTDTEQTDTEQTDTEKTDTEQTGTEQLDTEQADTEQTDTTTPDETDKISGTQENENSSQIVLNANLNKKGDAATLSGEYNLDETVLSEDAALLSVGDRPASGNYNANFYIYLDGSWQCIGTLTFSVGRSGNSYAATLSTSDVLELINESLGTSFTRSSISLYYASSQNATNYTAATVTNTTTTLGTSSRQNNLRGAKYVRIVAPGQNGNSTSLRFYTVNFIYEDGSSDTKYIQSGTSVTLPEGFRWKDTAGNTYSGGDSVNIASATDFTAYDDSRVRLEYDISFPTVSGVTVTQKPTVDGGSTSSETIEENNSATIKRISQENVIGLTNSSYAKITRVIHFNGWQIDGTEILLLPGTVIDWETLKSYATNGRISLTASWRYAPETTCTFYVKYDSIASTEGMAETEYTPCIFTSYVAGVDPALSFDELTERYGVNIEAVTDQEVLEVDKQVRAKYGSALEGAYLTSFPDDEYVFEQLKQYASQLTVDGVSVSVDDLNENGYAIRWYVFKCQSDSWHIDGKLVRKHGMMNVKKTFAGNKTAIETVKDGFYIEAVGSEKGTEYLTTDNCISYDSDTNTYTWQIDDVAYGEVWTLEEKEFTADGYEVYSEYIITDAAGEQSGSGVGSSVSVLGMTYATDIGEYEVLEVDFYNVYRDTQSLVIKKEDSETGRALSGAKFKLYQNDEPLTFTYNTNTETYHYDENGTITELSCENSGFMEVSIIGISYDEGNITVSESVVPQGYAGSGNVILGYDSGGNVAILSGTEARFNNNLLVIPNTSDTITVTVKKNWLCPEYAYEDVELLLFANSRAVNALFPSVTPTATLTEANGYTYTWTDLPAYANGQEIEWSVRETKIGNESCRSDYSFVNWLVYYQTPQYSYDENGVVTSVFIPIANDIQRVVLRITKTNMNKVKTLGGATFSLVRVDENFVPDEDFQVLQLTTNGSGEAIFYDLAYGTYAISETVAPDGYEPIRDPVYVTINADNTISVSDNFYVEIDNTSSLSVIIRNSEPIPIPQTGGPGTEALYGLSLMLMALAVYIYKSRNKNIFKGEK